MLYGIQETYAIAYADKDGSSFSKSEPWIMAEFGDDIEKCKNKVIELIKERYKKVIPFQFGKKCWNHIRVTM